MLEVVDIKTPIIGPASLSAAKGDCIAILGPSGSGKSIFLRAVVDLDPNEGTVQLDDVCRDSIPAYLWRAQVAMVPSETGWWADSVADHFETIADARYWLETLGLPDALGWEVARLSTGERQRLAIARALIKKPKVLILDEPTAALDVDTKRRVEDLIQAQCKRGVIVILVTHDREQASRLASKRYIMDGGVLAAAEGT